MSLSDGEIVQRCLAGEEEACRMLVERYDRPVHSLIRRLVDSPEDARDLTQETFFKAFRSLDSFHPERKFSAWIFRIASNLTIDFLRKKRVQTISMHGESEDEGEYRPEIEGVDSGPGQQERLESVRRKEALQQLVSRLAPHYRTVVELRYTRELSYDEISEVLDLPVGTVKARMHRAHHQLKSWLEGRDPEEL